MDFKTVCKSRFFINHQLSALNRFRSRSPTSRRLHAASNDVESVALVAVRKHQVRILPSTNFGLQALK